MTPDGTVDGLGGGIAGAGEPIAEVGVGVGVGVGVIGLLGLIGLIVLAIAGDGLGNGTKVPSGAVVHPGLVVFMDVPGVGVGAG